MVKTRKMHYECQHFNFFCLQNHFQLVLLPKLLSTCSTSKTTFNLFCLQNHFQLVLLPKLLSTCSTSKTTFNLFCLQNHFHLVLLPKPLSTCSTSKTTFNLFCLQNHFHLVLLPKPLSTCSASKTRATGWVDFFCGLIKLSGLSEQVVIMPWHDTVFHKIVKMPKTAVHTRLGY